MSNEQYLIVSYFTVGLACLALSLLTYALLRHSFFGFTKTIPGEHFGQVLRRLFLVGIILPALAGFLSVTFRSCEKDSYQSIIADRSYLFAKNQEQLGTCLSYMCIALFVWAIIVMLVLITAGWRRKKMVNQLRKHGAQNHAPRHS